MKLKDKRHTDYDKKSHLCKENIMAEYANAAKRMVPNMPAGGGGALFAVAGLAAGAYGLYNSVVTGIPLRLMRKCRSS